MRPLHRVVGGGTVQVERRLAVLGRAEAVERDEVARVVAVEVREEDPGHARGRDPVRVVLGGDARAEVEDEGVAVPPARRRRCCTPARSAGGSSSPRNVIRIASFRSGAPIGKPPRSPVVYVSMSGAAYGVACGEGDGVVDGDGVAAAPAARAPRAAMRPSSPAPTASAAPAAPAALSRLRRAIGARPRSRSSGAMRSSSGLRRAGARCDEGGPHRARRRPVRPETKRGFQWQGRTPPTPGR